MQTVDSRDSPTKVDRGVVEIVGGMIITIAAVFACLKGRWALAIAGLVVLAGIPAIIAAMRLARVDSWWAKRFYSEDKLSRSAERFPPTRDALRF